MTLDPRLRDVPFTHWSCAGGMASLAQSEFPVGADDDGVTGAMNSQPCSH